MARLTASERAALPDRAFAYVDSRGNRRLPISDAAHVRNALARFDQVRFESDAARERARRRLLAAAQRFRIVPIGFVTSQLRTERALATGADPPLPTGFVTLVMTDIEGSTPLLAALGDGYAAVLDAVRAVQRTAVEAHDGLVIELRADELFAVFGSPRAAIDAAIAIHRGLADTRWPGDHEVRVRAGVHSGYPTPSGRNYVGMAVHTAARVCEAAHGGQTILSGDTVEALTGLPLDGLTFRSLRRHHLRGIPGEVALHQVVAPGTLTRFPPPRC
jgi:class 3 adenylate cyclase